MRRMLPMLFTLTTPVAAVVTLHRLGREPGLRVPLDHFDAWLRTTPPTDAVLALGRLVGLAAAWWLLISTVLYTVALLSRRSGARRAARWVTLPGVRHWIDRALAASLVAGTVLGSGGTAVARVAGDPVAAVTTPTSQPVRTGRAGDPGALATTTTTSGEVATGSAPHAPAPESRAPDTPATPDERPDSRATDGEPPVSPPSVPAGPAAPAPAPTGSQPGVAVPGGQVPGGAPTAHVVAPGDSLWSIAAAHLAAVNRRTPGVAEVARYWDDVCAANRTRLHSGDLDLIFPGEVVELPPVT